MALVAPAGGPDVLDTLIAEQEAALLARTVRSHELHLAAAAHLPGGVASSWQDAPPCPVFVERGEGAHVWDVDGNEYVDLHAGFGTTVAGHAHPALVAAITSRVAAGTHFAQPVPDIIPVAAELARRFGLPLWRFANSGTEATMAAIHLMRAATGRRRIIKVEGTYHGHHDAVQVSVFPELADAGAPDQPATVREHGAIPPEVAALTHVVPFGRLDAVRRVLLAHPGEIAGMIIEPVMMNIGVVPPPPGYLDSLRTLLHTHGALLTFDEVKTGLTIGPGGATERFGVVPDIVCLAKALAGGVPCGAIGGTADVMGLIADGTYEQVGTFNGNPLTMAAAKAMLLEVLTPAGYAHLDRLREQFVDGALHVLGRHRLAGYVSAYGAKGAIVFSPVRIRDYRDFCRYDARYGHAHWLYQHNGGVFLPPWGKMEQWTVTVQHDADDVDLAIANDVDLSDRQRCEFPRCRPAQQHALADGSESFGRVGLPEPISDLAAREWDAVVVGGGHNGLTCAAYLAEAGRSVLVLERRDRLGGACTLEEPFPGYAVSPCAYVVGLLDARVVDELALRRHGYKVFVAEPAIWCPFDDGTWYAQFADHDRTVAGMRDNGFSEADIKGQFEYEAFFDRMRRALREGVRDTWVGEAPDEAELRALLDGDEELATALFETSIADVIDRFVVDPRLQQALYGQGVIGAWAGPRSPGTASIKLMHFQGTLEGVPMAWGYVEGGMGRISFAIAEAATAAGAVLAAGVPVAEIRPGEGVVLEGGDVIRARTVISNADPVVTGRLLGASADPRFAARVDGWRTTSPVVKVNCGLSRLPRWTAVPDSGWPNGAPVSISLPLDAAQQAFEDCRRGIPSPGFAELYFQTAYDPTVAPPGKHTMSVFAQYAPYTLDDGTWDERRDEIGHGILGLIGRYCDVDDVVEHVEVLGPPDIEARIGLTGGHIFQGECTPDQMWWRRFSPRAPGTGVYLCGAATHPAGSVIGLNGRNAAMAVLADLA